MALHLCKWNDGWHSASWASARGLWRATSPEEDAADQHAWREAACEDGGFLRVLWCELCQLAADIVPHSAAPNAGAPTGVPAASGQPTQSEAR